MQYQQDVKSLAFSGNLNHLKPTIFTEMSKMAKDYKAINLSQGFPGFETEPRLINLVHDHMKAGHNQYSPMAGMAPLREELCRISEEQYGVSYDADKEITITAGATQAISTIMATTIREGDEVIIFSPAYDCYIPMIELFGGVPINVKLQYPDYSIDWEQVKRVVNHRTKMILVNTPHNPSGSVIQLEGLNKLEEIVQNSNILLLADEVYEHIVLNGAEHHSIRSRPNLRNRAFVVGSLGKTLHVTGWKTGYCMAPENLMKEFQKVHQYQVFSTNTPVQLGMAAYLQEHDVNSIGPFYEQKQEVFLDAMEGTGFKPLPTQGSYFQLMDYSEITDEPDVDFAIRLTKEYGVAAIPLSPFYRDPTDNKVLRFCFAKTEDTLRNAGKTLQNVK